MIYYMVAIISYLIISYDAKILRKKCFFDANFELVYSNTRLVTGFTFNKTLENVHSCVEACILKVKCQSFNFHKVKKRCQLLEATKFDENAIAESADGWTHYETDPENRKIGDNCNKLNPCPDHLCEDICSNPGFICTCLDGHVGERCQRRVIGCFKRDARTPSLPDLIITDRDSSHANYSGQEINWADFGNYLNSFGTRCEKKARNGKYDFFAIGYYGECHAGRDNKKTLRPAQNCVTGNYKSCNKMALFCSGIDGSEYIYKLKSN